MKIIITANEALDLGIWDKLCKIKGIGEYAMNEGMDGDEEITLSKQEAIDLGVYPIKSSMGI